MSRTKMWWLNDESLAMLERGYLKPNQSVEEKLTLICNYAAKKLNKPELSERFYEIISKGWASLSSPIWANFGEGRGLPISCVTGDTWINTKNGGKKAKDIKIGDLVLTHKNRFRKVTNVMPTRDRGDIWKIKVNTRMTDLFITGNHQILTNLGWVRIDELDRNKHLVAVNGEVDFGEGVNYTIDMKDFTDYKFVIEEGLICKAVERVDEKGLKKNKSESYVTYYSKPKEFVDVDEDLAWALGLWFAEGSLSTSNKKEPNGIRITLNADEEKDVAERWLSVMSEKFNLKGNIYESEVIRKGKVNKWLSVNFNGKVVGNLFSSFGKGCKIKELPSWVLRLPKNLQAKVLEGFLLGDGSKDKSGGNRVTVSNPKLLLQLYNIGLHLGKDMSLQMQSKASKLSSISHVYTLVFRGYENSLSKTATNSGVKFKDGLTYCPIVTLERTDKVEDVYDFTVEEDHSFSCAGVVVHNCFTSLVGDDTDHIFKTVHEVAMMTKNGGGTATDFSALRPKGSKVSGGGSSSGVMSFIEVFDSTIKNVSQAGVRRGGFAAYLDINHLEIKDFLRIKDKDSTLQSINNAVVVDDKFMREMIDGDKDKREVWALVLKSRREKGIPYIFFKDTANRNAPEVYKEHGKTINSSNLCVSKNTLTLTDMGYLPMGDLEDCNVNIWNGEQWSNVDIVKTGENQRLLKVITSEGYEIDCTPYHKFYVQVGYGSSKNNIVEKRANELQMGDKLIKFELPVIEGYKTLDKAYTNGFYSGDGCYHEGKALLYIYKPKECVIPFLELGDVNLNYQENQKRYSATNVKGLKDKFFVPDATYTIKSRLEWLAGILDADGTVTDFESSQTLQIASVQKEFLREMQLMLQTLGCDSKVTFSRAEGKYMLPANDGTGSNKEYNCKEVHRLLINGNSLFKLLQLGIDFKRLKPSGKKPARECSAFIKIKEVKELEGLHDTYCFTEPLKNMGMFNGILTGNCNEIMLSTDENESLVCCLSSMNLYLYDEWKDTDAVQLMIMLLDAVMSDFIEKTTDRSGFERANKFAREQRALGLGVLGWHSYLQHKDIPFDSLQASMLNKMIFKHIKEESVKASQYLAKEYGEPSLMKGTGLRGATLLAVAPTTSSASILGQSSPSIEPYKSNFYTVDLAKGSFVRKNKSLHKLLISKGKDTKEVWDSIMFNQGSVQHLDFLSDHEKAVFKTFAEINPEAIIDQAADRQHYICQGQSLNLLIPHVMEIKEVNRLHIRAWEKGLKGLYYQRGTNATQEQLAKMKVCSSCEA